MAEDKGVPSQRTKTANETSKTLQGWRLREDMGAAPRRLTELEIADRNSYQQLERLGAPSAYTVALAVLRKKSVEHFTR